MREECVKLWGEAREVWYGGCVKLWGEGGVAERVWEVWQVGA